MADYNLDSTIAEKEKRANKTRTLVKELQEHRSKRDRSIAAVKDISRQAVKILDKAINMLNPVDDLEKDQDGTSTYKQKPFRSIRVPFAIKNASRDGKIENNVVEYVKREVSKGIKIDTYDWNNKRDPNVPLVVFCIYTSRIGCDVEAALRGVQDEKVLLIILHYTRKALLRGDPADDNYLLPDDLKARAEYIAHFSFDNDHVFDCWQNEEARNRLCAELKNHFPAPAP